MQIVQPYLLFLGDVTDPLAAKTARGVYQWRPEACVGQLRLTEETVSLGIADLSLESAWAQGARTLLLGTANAGGVIPSHWLSTILAAMELGFNIASGLHQKLTALPAIAETAARKGVALYDVRHTAAIESVGTGKRREGKRVLTVGTDCSVGKMYTALSLEAAMIRRGIAAQFKATGQTGIFIAGDGIAVDAVVSDFISGAVEGLSPSFNDHEWDIIEGQGSLYHPAFAGVSLGLLHGAQADVLILCHEVGRPHMRHLPHVDMPSLVATMSLNLQMAQRTNPNVTFKGISLNTSALDEAQATALCHDLEAQFNMPVTDPYRFGIENIVDELMAVEA
ncbi:N-acetyltransferase DgcN [Thaumasiovibrio subtropicus]|uniref:N-acetyltransferase DgcN n=1 Tax=Thaumasiovibrio subtropicus TaxID=1891207 RepID=UPI000B34B694|nr:N-acetyltransferase DgcN [Thaumasiovibrio subtropicus]